MKALMTQDERVEMLLQAQRPDLIKAVEHVKMTMLQAIKVLDISGPARVWDRASPEEKITLARGFFPALFST